MRKIANIIFTIVLLVLLVACEGKVDKPEMYIEKARLSEQEERIAELLGANNDQLIYYFVLDESVKSIQVKTYELIDGAWSMISGMGGYTFFDKEGRLALDFDDLAEGLRVALQSENNNLSTKYLTEAEEDFAGIGRATSMLNNLAEITYEQEIPLVIQISTSKNTVSSYNVEYFFMPDEYEKLGYEHVYAITIRFSQKTVGELETIE